MLDCMGSNLTQILGGALLCAGGATLMAFGYLSGGGATLAVGVVAALRTLSNP